MQLKLRNLFCAITILVGVLATKPCAQSLGRDDDGIWIEFDMQIRPQPGHPTGNTYRGGKLSLRVSGLLEPMEYDTPEAIDNPDIIGFCCTETPWTMSAEPCQEVEPDGRVSSLPMGQINHQAKMDVTMKCDLSTGLCELRLFSREITTEQGLVDFDYTFGCLYEAERQETSCQPRVSITRDDLEGDFEKSYTWEDIGGGLFVTGCASIPTYRLVLRSRPPDETKVTLAGCADIMMGVAAEITATAKPEGGTYTWSVEPADVLSISGSGSTATVTGKSAGRATIRVEYQPKRGKKVEATLPGSVVELLSVNGGAEIPQIGLYDETGAAKPAVQIPTVQDPPDAALMSFPVVDPGVAKVENLGTGLLIQGVNEGTTTARGKTRCGDQDEHIITIEVVPCDKETKQKIRDQIKDLKTQKDDNLAQINRLRSDPEYQRAKSEINRHLTKMGVKALGIFSSAAGEGDLGDVADILGEIHDITEEGTWTGHWSITDMYIKSQINLVKKLTLGIVNDLIEYGEAGSEVGNDLDVMKATSRALEEPLRRSQELQKQYDEANRRQVDICKDYAGEDGEPGKPQPPAAEPQPPTPQPTKPQPPEPESPTPQPTEPKPPRPEPIEPPVDSKPPAPDDDDIIGDPPLPPTTPPGSSGGFQVECGCDGWDQSGWSNNSEGMSRISQDIGSMVPCLEDFNKNTVKSMEIMNDSTSQLFDLMEQALTLPETQKVQAFREFLPIMSDLKAKYTQFGQEFKSMSDSLSRCGPTVERAVEIIGTAEPETE